MPDPSLPDGLTQELLQVAAAAIADHVAKQPQVDVAPAPAAVAPSAATATSAAQTGALLGQALAPLAAPVLARAENKLASRKLWTALGAIVTLAAQNTLGLNLSPAAQLGIAAIAAIYVAAQGLVDGAISKGGGNG